MTKQEALDDIETIYKCFVNSKMGKKYISALQMALECIQHCIDEENEIEFLVKSRGK